MLLKNLLSLRKEKVLKYIRIEDRLRCVFSWKLLERIILENFSLNISKESFSINNYGKPLINNRNNIHFNISHSGEIVCCIVDSFPVGIDVEAISSINLDIAFNEILS